MPQCGCAERCGGPYDRLGAQESEQEEREGRRFAHTKSRYVALDQIMVGQSRVVEEKMELGEVREGGGGQLR